MPLRLVLRADATCFSANIPQSLSALSYSVTIPKGLEGKPKILLSEPRLVEVMGAGFTKAPGAKVCLVSPVGLGKLTSVAALCAPLSSYNQDLERQRKTLGQW